MIQTQTGFGVVRFFNCMMTIPLIETMLKLVLNPFIVVVTIDNINFILK